MNLQYRIDLLAKLGEYMLSEEEEWTNAKEKAEKENGWFIPEFINYATQTIASTFLQKHILQQWAASHGSTSHGSRLHEPGIKTIGLTMAGNIPLAGFHDWLSVFISGHKAMIKPSSKDKTLIRHLTEKITEWEPGAAGYFQFSEMLKGCDAYIATGSNNSSRYFDYYFGKYPHIIRRNRSSAAVLTGEETTEELESLADDVYLYFGLGCRNVTKLLVPSDYDFIPLLSAFKKYNWLADHNKYKNNYDYNLAILLLNKVIYMSNDSILLVESPALFSPISQLNYSFYRDKKQAIENLEAEPDLQCIVAKGHIPFGKAQKPAINDYADGMDTLAFLAALPAGDKIRD